MAEIPIERKSTIPWWVWALLAALLLALLVWWISDDDEVDDAEVVATTAPVVETDTGVAAPVDDTAETGAITELSAITSGTAASLIGREVRLTGVTAGSVPEDAGFWIADASGQRVWVVLDEVRTPDTQIEGRVDVDEGDAVDIMGTLRSVSEQPTGAALPGPTAPLPDGVDYYIFAERVMQTS